MRNILLLALIGGLSLVVALVAAPSESPVADAAERGAWTSVSNLLKEGADANAAQGDGMTALHWVAESGDSAIAETLIYAGAQVEAMTRIGQYTPLHVASRAGNLAVADILLEAGAEVNAITTNSGVSALHLAAASGNAALVGSLLDCGAEVNALESEWGQSPLIFAAAQNRVEAIRVLLEAGADAAITSRSLDFEKEGKLTRAVRNRQSKVLAAFGKKGVKEATSKELQAAVLSAREIYLSGEVPKERASDTGNRRFSRPSTKISKGGLTALLHAARQGHIDVSLALLEGGADVNQVSKGDETSPLLMALINAQFDLAMHFLERGADPNQADSLNGVTPLWATVNAEWQPRTRFPQPQQHRLQNATYLDLMKALLEAGADPDARVTGHPWYMVYTDCGNRNCGLADSTGATAFWRAAYATDVEGMRLLVQYGADPNIPTKAPAPRAPRRNRNPNEDDPSEEGVIRGPKMVQPVAPGLWPATNADSVRPDPSGLARIKEGGPGVFPIHAASGVGYGEGFAGNAHRHAPDSWLATVKYLVEELGADVNARDLNGYNPLHHAAARGDNELILYLVEKGCDVTAVSRRGQTTADMANSPVSRISPIPETVALLERLGSKNNHNCVSC